MTQLEVASEAELRRARANLALLIYSIVEKALEVRKLISICLERHIYINDLEGVSSSP